LLLLEAEISGAQAYVDCVGDSLEDLERVLVDHQSKAEGALTARSIAVGAAGALATGALELAARDSAAAPITGIVAGGASAGLGVATMLVPSPRIGLRHAPNVLAAVWRGTGEDPSFSQTVWRLLFLPRRGGRSPAERLRARWRDALAGLDGERRARVEGVLFGAGGEYDLATLRLREVMRDPVETGVDLMNRALHGLMRAWTSALQAGAPRGAVVEPLLPDAYRRFVAEVGYPVIGFGYGDRDGLTFLLPSPREVTSIALEDAQRGLPEDAAEAPVRCRFAFFAGWALSDLEGFAFGAAGAGEPVVWRVEGAAPRQGRRDVRRVARGRAGARRAAVGERRRGGVGGGPRRRGGPAPPARVRARR
jgi:hypothetical protein